MFYQILYLLSCFTGLRISAERLVIDWFNFPPLHNALSFAPVIFLCRAFPNSAHANITCHISG